MTLKGAKIFLSSQKYLQLVDGTSTYINLQLVNGKETYINLQMVDGKETHYINIPQICFQR